MIARVRRARVWRLFRCLVNQIDRWLDALREIRGAAHPVHVHVEDAWLLPEEMIVERRDVDAVLQERRHHGIDFVLGEDEIAHHHVHALPFVRATQPPKPKGVGAERLSIVTLRSLRGIFTFKHAVLEVSRLAERREHALVFRRHSCALARAGASTALATTSDPIASLNDVIVTSPYLDVASVRLRYTPQPRRVRQALRRCLKSNSGNLQDARSRSQVGSIVAAPAVGGAFAVARQPRRSPGGAQ